MIKSIQKLRDHINLTLIPGSMINRCEYLCLVKRCFWPVKFSCNVADGEARWHQLESQNEHQSSRTA